MDPWHSASSRSAVAPPPMHRLEDGELAAGEPVPYDLFDDAGRRMMLEGATAPDPARLERMIERGVYCDAARHAALHPPPDTGPAIVLPRVSRVRPWRLLRALQERLDGVLACLAGEAGPQDAPPGTPDAPAALRALAACGAELQRLCALDPDALLAVPLLLRGGRHGTRHAIATAIVLEFMLTRLSASAAHRRTATLAALTMNLGMFALQETLYGHSGALSAAQREGVLDHPQRSVALLRAAGVEDADWLGIVAHHHEHADGTGYPMKLSGAALSGEAQALMVADRWCAMVGERGYRAGAPPDQALQWLMTRLGAQAAPAVGRALSDTVGPTPPGTAVRLATGELGIVFRRTRDAAAPLVLALRSAIGATSADGVRRATGEARMRIEGCVPLAELGCEVDPERVWEAAEVVEPGTVAD
jgi:hypothetical protein